VVIQEDAARSGDHVDIPAVSDPRHVRPAGQDFVAGTRLLESGVRLDAWRLSLVAAAGRAAVDVARRPRVAVLSTGEEIVAPGGAPGPFQIYNSGTTALAALIEGWGGQALALSEVGDDVAATARAVADVDSDLIVTIGGASVGDHDLVKPALRSLGLEMIVESIAVRPGKPTWFGRLGDGRRVLGLPGNPASAMVCAELFLRPLLAAMQGGDPTPALVIARTAIPLGANGGREHWMRARLDHRADGCLYATAFADQDSALVGVFARADALLRRRVDAPAAAEGALIEVLPLARGA
jgi:molybdopterin molybdotransferase